MVVGVAAAQSADPLLLDTRLTVHTLVREDIFAGWRTNTLDRLSKAEQNIEILLKERPDQRAMNKPGIDADPRRNERCHLIPIVSIADETSRAPARAIEWQPGGTA